MKYRKKPEHNGHNYLKAILESLVEYNAIARLDVTNLLHIGYKQSVGNPTKFVSNTLVLEMLSKWMQVLEDLSMLCMIFENPSNIDETWEMYVKISNQQIFKFLHRTRRGLSQKAIMRIFGLNSAYSYYRAGKIRKSEIPHFKKVINGEVISHRKTLGFISNAYAGNKIRGEKRIEPSILLNIYFKTKHGFKILHPTETAKKVWNFSEDDIAVMIRIKKLKWGRNMLEILTFPKFTPRGVEILVERVEQWSDLTGKIAKIQLNKLNDHYWVVPNIRLLKTEELLKTHPKPGRNEECLCGSGMKFKECCESRLK